VPARRDPFSSSLDTIKPDVGIIEEWIERSHCIASAAYTCDDSIRQSAFLFLHLLLYLISYYALEITHHHRVRVRAYHRAYEVVSCLDVCNPVTDRFVDRILQCLASRLNRMYRCAKQLHSKHI